MKICKQCGSTERYNNGNCKPCNDLKSASYYSKNSDRLKRLAKEYKQAHPECNRKWELKNKYGMSIEEYDRLLEAQGGRCFLCLVEKCQSGRRFAVDHCHKTNKIRGLLCLHCNKALGLFRDNPDVLRRAAAYVELS